ncbi:MAG TPA: DEAD/DEAH box helicase, partial [Opitutaceae bacterium]|nr:DEAD/DEAH box helicase [Opitutaceae bacterium]
IPLGLPVVSAATLPAAAARSNVDQAAETPAEAGDFRRFVSAAEVVRGLSRKNEKVQHLSTYLAGLGTRDAGLAALYFTGRPFAAADDRSLQLGWSAIRRAVLEVTGLTPDDFRRTYLRTSDSGETAEALLTGRTRPVACTLRGNGFLYKMVRFLVGAAVYVVHGRITAEEIGDLLDELARLRSPALKLTRLQERLATLTPGEGRYLVKIMTGDLRIGLKEGLVEEAVAQSSGQPVEAVREAVMVSGHLGAVVAAAREGRLDRIALRLFQPIAFMLASPEPTAEALLARLSPPVWLEEKYDGIRCQVHARPDRAEIYSRDLHRISDQFPELARAARTLGEEVIIDAELLAWREGRALPFAELQRRLGRRGDDFFFGEEVPVSLSCFDLLAHRGESLLRHPLSERRRRLESVLSAPGAAGGRFLLAPVRTAADALTIEEAFLTARQRGNEGLMAKDPASPYTPGRRGLAWLKLKKAYATLDVVVVGVEYGHGKRRGVLSDYTFAIRDESTDRLLTVGKAYTGLTDVEIARFTEHFLEHTLEVRGRFRRVVPQIVLEVAFDTIQPSARRQRFRAPVSADLPHPSGQDRGGNRHPRHLPTPGRRGGRPSRSGVAVSAPLPPPDPGDDTLHASLHPELSRWFRRRFGAFSPAQRAAVPAVLRGESTLLSSPTGSGKTLAAFLAVFDALRRTRDAGGEDGGIAAIYVSPLRALAYDLQKNLKDPLTELGWSWLRIAARTGDTTPAERARQKRRPPHLLVTTPESLTLLLSQPGWQGALRSTRYLIIDELHALAENKRGALLMLAAERLEELVASPRALAAPNTPRAPGLVRIGLSATVSPLPAMAEFLVGPGRSCRVLDVAQARPARVEVFSPLSQSPYPPAGFTATRVLRELGDLIATKRTTLVFTNTRSGAESIGVRLKQMLPSLAARIEVHHASLDRAIRLEVEDRLKKGELRAVVCSTSLEMGIDIGSVDTVVMISAPKGVARALQRVGRSGHSMGETSHGLLVATNINDLAECAVTALCMKQRALEPVRFSRNPLDVLAQHLVGMAVFASVTPDEAYACVRRSQPFRDLDRGDFDRVVRYLEGGGESLERNYKAIFGKIRIDASGCL